MKRHKWVIAAVALVAVVAIGSRLLLHEERRNEGEFPELRPALDPPPGYALELHDGPDFYTWVLAEREKVGRRHRSGLGIYFGHFPNLAAAKGATERVAGRVCGKEITWLVERNENAADSWARRDAVLAYDHGPGFCTIALHVWVWGASEEQVAPLAKQLEELSFVSWPRQSLRLPHEGR